MATTPHILSFMPDLRSDVFHVGNSQIRLRTVLDSAASEHVVGSDVDADLLSPTAMVSRVANGSEARSTGQLNTTTPFGPAKIYQIPGCPTSLSSLPQLTGMGYKFFLQDDGPSLMIDPNLKTLVIPRSKARGGVRMWHVDLLLDPDVTGSRKHNASWLPGGMQSGAEVYSIVIDDLNLDAFPDSDLIPLAHTAPSAPAGHAVIGTELAARTTSRFKKLSGRTLAATYAFPSRKTMSATAKSAIGWGELPSETSLRFGQAAGVHRRLKVSKKLPSDRQTSLVPVGVCFDLDIVPLSPEDIQGCSCAALFKEHRSAYLKPYLLPAAADFWVAVRELSAWVKRVLRVELKYLFVDSDPRWTNVHRGAHSFDTVDARLLLEETGIEFRRKPANTHALDAENSVQAVRAAANVMVQYMHMNGPKVISFALVHACLVLNHLSKPQSGRELLANGATPAEIVHQTSDDSSRLAGPLFSSVTAKIEGTKPGQMRATSRQGIYVGLREGVSGWMVLFLSNPLRPAVVSNMILDPDPGHRPMTLAKHDFFDPEGSSLPLPCKEWHKQIRHLFDMPGGHNEDNMMILSPLTGAPIAVVPALTITDDLVYLTPSEALEHVEGYCPAAAVATPSPSPSPSSDASSATPAGTPSPSPSGVLTPGTPLTTSDRRAVRRIPVDTPILVEQINPKKPSTQSFDRYEAYKDATTIGEFLARTPKRWADFANDFEKGYVSVPATAIMAVLPAFLVMALGADSAFLSSDWAPVPVPLPQPDQPLVFAISFSGTAHPYHARMVQDDMDWDRGCRDYHHSVGSVGRDLPRPAERSPFLPASGPVVCVPPTTSAYVPDDFSLSKSVSSADIHSVDTGAASVTPPVPQAVDLAAVLGVTLEEFASASVDGIENVMRKAEHLLETQEVFEAYITLGNDFLASTPAPASVSGPGAPANLKELLRHPRKDEFLAAAREEVTSLAGDEFNTIRVVPIAAFDERVRERGASNVKVIPSVVPFSIKSSGRLKARFCAAEMRRFGVSTDTKSPAAQLCSVRWHGCLTLIFKMKSKQLDATKAYCRGKRDPKSPSIFLRLPSVWSAMGYPTHDRDGRPYLIEVIGNLYGTQQAGRIFWQFMRDFLLDIGFVQSDVEPCLFYLWWDESFTCSRSGVTHAGKQQAIVVVFVDDSRLSWRGLTIEAYVDFHMERVFGTPSAQALLETVGNYVGIDIDASPDHLSMSNTKTRDAMRAILEEYDLPVLDVSTPLPPDAKRLVYAPISDENPAVPVVNGRRIVGCGSWLALTVEPLLSYPCCLLAHAAPAPSKYSTFCMQWMASYAITHRRPLFFCRTKDGATTITHFDATQADQPDMASHYGYWQQCCNASLRWRAFSGRQVHAATRGPELVSAVAATHVSMYQRLLMYEARLGRLPGDIIMPFFGDNTAVMSNATADNIHLGSRHLAIRIGVIRQAVRDLIIKPAYIHTSQNVADAMTKPMDKKHVLTFTPTMYGVRK